MGQGDGGSETSDYFNYLLPLDRGPEDLFRSFHKDCVQRAVRNGRRDGVEVHCADTVQDLKTFYRLHLMTRKKHGVPVQPWRFFRNLWETFTPRDMLTLMLARHQGTWLAGIIVLWYKDVAYYKYGASDEAWLHLRANQLLMWEAICLAQQRGCRVFDFGRTSAANPGLCQYKSRWATHQVPLHSLRLPNNGKTELLDESSRKHALFRSILARMPLPLIRVSGELFYKHFA